MIDSQLFQEKELCIRNVAIHSGNRPAGRTVDHRKNPRPYHGLFFIWEGEARFWPNDSVSLAVHPGELLYIPAGCCYRMKYVAEATAFVLVNLELFTADGAPAALSRQMNIIARDKKEQRLFQIMTRFERVGTQIGPQVTFRKKELVYQLLSDILEENGPFSPREKKYAAILPGVLLLQETYLENFPISKFAEVCNISLTSFRSLFTQKFGMSPLQYRNHLRINRAIALLQEGSCTVAEAAYASGFDNVGYFFRYYKKVTGETPRTTQMRSV